MRVGLVDADGHRFPNLACMKLSAWHKSRGDSVEWYGNGRPFDRVYVSKVFTFTPDVGGIACDDVRRGGTGYGLDNRLPDEVEHMMPDYSLYGDLYADTAYGFLTRGCPRGCPFCIVAPKEGRASRKVADLSEWWSGQGSVKLLDPNLLACPDWKDLMGQLAESRALVDFTQGLDIRLLTDDKIAALNEVRAEMVHFAWDGTDDLEPLFRKVGPQLRIRRSRRAAYVLVNFGTTMEWNLHRVNVLRDCGFIPYVMIYDKENAPREVRQLQRWANNRILFSRFRTFAEYQSERNGRI